MANLPSSNVRRLVLVRGGDIRMSAEAVTKAIDAAEDYLARLGERAASRARAQGRKTIMPEDIESAAAMT